jgi:hypothetical protein
MKVGELKKLLAEIPDEQEIMAFSDEVRFEGQSIVFNFDRMAQAEVGDDRTLAQFIFLTPNCLVEDVPKMLS